MKLEASNRRKTGKLMDTWKLNNTLLNDQRIKEIKGEMLKSIFRQTQTETKTYGIQLNSSKRNACNSKCLH